MNCLSVSSRLACALVLLTMFPLSAVAQNTNCTQVVGDFAGEVGATLAVCGQLNPEIGSPAATTLQLAVVSVEGEVVGMWSHDVALSEPESGFEDAQVAVPELTVLEIPDGEDGILIALRSSFEYYNLHSLGECDQSFRFLDVVALRYQDAAWGTALSLSIEEGAQRNGCCTEFIEWADFLAGRRSCFELRDQDEREEAGCGISCDHVDYPVADRLDDRVEVLVDSFGSPVIWRVGAFERTGHALQEDGLFAAGEPEIACPEESTFQVSGFVQRCLDGDGQAHGPTLEMFASGGWKDWSRFEHGTPAGVRRRWFENGNQLLLGGYNADGQAHGRWTAFTEDGQTRKVEIFVQGLRHGPAWFVEDGIRHGGFYREGERDGRWTARPVGDSEAPATAICYLDGSEVECTD